MKVLSSPQLLVLDNEPARLQVGNLVPYLTSSSQSTLQPTRPSSTRSNYRETGVIMEVTPRVNSGGLVTLDISQEVSDVDTRRPSSGIARPTFLSATSLPRRGAGRADGRAGRADPRHFAAGIAASRG